MDWLRRLFSSIAACRSARSRHSSQSRARFGSCSHATPARCAPTHNRSALLRVRRLSRWRLLGLRCTRPSSEVLLSSPSTSAHCMQISTNDPEAGSNAGTVDAVEHTAAMATIQNMIRPFGSSGIVSVIGRSRDLSLTGEPPRCSKASVPERCRFGRLASLVWLRLSGLASPASALRLRFSGFGAG